ncbi:MAG: VCBS repeat-containing protein [Lentisphaeria bacterium]|nr:VCBS repeat-containing protein [Lentisphaeria bacterium]
MASRDTTRPYAHMNQFVPNEGRQGRAVPVWRRGAGVPLCSSLAFLLVVSATAMCEVVWEVSFDKGRNAEPLPVATGPGMAGMAGRFAPGLTHGPGGPLTASVQGAFTITVWMRAREWAEVDASGFGTEAPPTLVACRDGHGEVRAVFRVRRGILELALRGRGSWQSVMGIREIPPGEWVHAAVSVGEGRAQLYLNGVPEGAGTCDPLSVPLVEATAGIVAKRVFRGELDSMYIDDTCLDVDAIRRLVPTAVRRRVEDFAVPSLRPEPLRYLGRALRLVPSERAPLIASLAARCLVLPWYGAGSNDVLAEGTGFNGGAVLFREVSPGLYGPPISLATVIPDAVLPRSPFFRLDRPDGLFDVLSVGTWGSDSRTLLRHRNVGPVGSPLFRPPAIVPCNGTGFADAYRASPAAVQDMDGDGVTDLVLVHSVGKGAYLPDWPDGFWTGQPMLHSGPGRGYSVNGRWLGDEGRFLFTWARGAVEEGELCFGPELPIYSGTEDFPLQWRGHGTPRAACLRRGADAWLVLAGSIDGSLAVPMRIDDKAALRCGPPVPFLSAERLEHIYFPHAMDVRDLDADETPELLLSGNPGGLVILRGTTPGTFTEHQARVEGGDLTMETLIVPCRGDWDRDGRADIVAGDASGWLALFRGTADPYFYHAPEPLNVGTTAVHIQAGEAGSIQGPNEARWGYLNPTLADWDGDGVLDILTGDIRACLSWYCPAQLPHGLQSPRLFSRNGHALPAAWRQRIGVVSHPSSPPALVYLDWNGILSLGQPDKVGSAEIAVSVPLRYADGQTVRLDGPTGLWGRAKLAVTDWDNDGVWDILFGTNRSCQRFFCPDFAAKEACPFLLRNAGTPTAPVLERPVPIRLVDGTELAFGVHIAAVWPSDMNGDGREDVLVGAEDGRVYVFLREELVP